MRKQLPTDEITNELTGASVFFQKRSPTAEAKPQLPTLDELQPEHHSQTTQPATAALTEKPNLEQSNPETAKLTSPNGMATSNHATMPPRHPFTPPANHPVRIQAEHPPVQQAASLDPMLPLVLEQIRKVVKQVGKEAATFRLTQAEKQQMADIVYTYKRRGYRTTDNELARIAINWLLLNYQEQGEQSVLASVLELLHR